MSGTTENTTAAAGGFEVCPRLRTCPRADYEHKLMYCYGDYRRCPLFRGRG